MAQSNQSPNQAHSESIFKVEEPIPGIAPTELFDIGFLTVANTTTTLFFVLVVLLAVSAFSKFRTVPGKFQSFIEVCFLWAEDLFKQILDDQKTAKKVSPYFFSLLFFIVIANLLPLVPFMSPFYITKGDEHIMLFRGITTDFNVTLAMSIVMVVMVQIVGIISQGFSTYLSHFVQIGKVIKGFRKSLGDGALSLVNFFVGLIEIIAEIAKMASLSLRLFGNMFAHEVLTVILLGVLAFALPAIWMGMGILIGVVQAIVFVSLVAVYFSLARGHGDKKAH